MNKVTKRNNLYVCPHCNEEYSASGDEVLTFYEYVCPRCESDITFEGNEDIGSVYTP